MTATSTTSRDSRASGDRWFLWSSLLPAAVVLFLVGVVPLLYAGWLSLHDYDLVRPPQIFIGLENFAELLTDGRFQYSMAFTFLFALAATSIEVVLGFLIAWLLADRQDPRSALLGLADPDAHPLHGRAGGHGLHLQDAHL